MLMPEQSEIKEQHGAALIGGYGGRMYAGSPDTLKPWKIISQNNQFIIWLSILLFAIYAFSRYGFNWIALSTSLIVSVPIGFTIAFFETGTETSCIVQADEDNRQFS